MTATTAQQITYIIPCGGKKVGHTTTARNLYTGSAFQLALATVEEAAALDGARVLIMSAKHGLLELDDMVAPYDVKLDRTTKAHEGIQLDELTEQALQLGLDESEVYAFLPAAYFERLHAALSSVYAFPADCYEAAPGIGFMRGVLSSIRRFYGVAA